MPHGQKLKPDMESKKSTLDNQRESEAAVQCEASVDEDYQYHGSIPQHLVPEALQKKAASAGDVTSSQPGVMNPVEKAKYDEWSGLKGLDKEEAQKAYMELVKSLTREVIAKEDAASATLDGLVPLDGLKVDKEGQVFKVALDRPSKGNIFTLATYRGITAALKAANEDPSTTVTLITANKSYFCVGNDATNFASVKKEETAILARVTVTVLERYIQDYIDHQKFLIGVINGPAVGIAVTLLPLFDFVLSTDKATFQASFPTLGQSPEGASSYTFPLLMGQLRAVNVLLFGKKLTAHDALEYGLLSKVTLMFEFYQLLLAGLLFLAVDLSQQQFFCHNTEFNLTETTPSVEFWHQTIIEGTEEEECAIIATVLGRLKDCTSIRIQMQSDLSLFGLLKYTNEHAFGFKCKSYYETCNSPKKLLSLTNVKWDEDSYNNKLLVGDRQAFDCVRKHLHRLYWSNQPDYIMEKRNFKPSDYFCCLF